MTKVWKCDGCGEPVQAGQGFVEWVVDDDGPNKGKSRGYRIVHRGAACSAYAGRGVHDQSMALIDAAGENGLVRVLGLIDPGHHKKPTSAEPETSDLRGVCELMRRLFVENYEEARSKMDSADPAEWPADGNENWVYAQATLRGLIEGRYDSRD